MTILLRRQSTVAGVYILVLILVGIIVWHGASSRSARIEEEKREVSETEEKKIPERKKEVMVSLMAPEKPTPKQKVEPPTQTPAKRAKTAAAPKTIKPAAATAAAALSRKKETPAKATPAPKAAKSQPTVDKFPQIVAQHQSLGFQAYLRALVRAGSRIFIGNMDQKNLLAAVSLEDGELLAPGSLAGLAVGRARIVDDPGAETHLARARQQFGPGNYSLVVLFPQHVEEWLVRKLDQESRQAGINPATLLRFDGQYQLNGQQLVLLITQAVEREGRQIPLSVRLNFKEVSRG